MTTPRLLELETLLATRRYAQLVKSNYDMWEDRGKQFSDADYIAQMDAAVASARRDDAEATAALEALVAKLRAESPAEVAAWADAHEAYLAAWLADLTAAGKAEYVESFIADDRAKWAAVRTGASASFYESCSYPADSGERYRQAFGFELQAIESVHTY